MKLEITIHRFGDPAEGPTDFGPELRICSETAHEYVQVTASRTAMYCLHLTIRDWTPVDDDWMSVTVDLDTVNGFRVGSVPALIYRHPSDVPTAVLIRRQDLGSYTVAMRRAS